jgi:competence protein ComEA
LGRLRFRGTRRTVSHDAARERLALLGAGFDPLRSEGPAPPGPALDEDVGDAASVPSEPLSRSTPESLPWLPWLPADSTVADPETAELAPAERVTGEMAATDPVAEESVSAERDAPAPAATGSGRHAARPLPWRTRLRAALSDRLSPTVRSAMDGTFSGHHLGVLLVVLATGIAIAAWWVLAGRPEQQPVPTVSFGSASAGPQTPGASTPTDPVPTASGSGPLGEEVIVDVAGKVRDPGIVTLPAGSRVVDALEAAGGPKRGVDLTPINLARVLVDGEQLLVGLTPAVAPTLPGSTADPSITGLVNLNTADQTILETLPGVGPVTAQAILDWRADNGAFTSVDELLEVDGIGEVTLGELRDLVTV